MDNSAQPRKKKKYVVIFFSPSFSLSSIQQSLNSASSFTFSNAGKLQLGLLQLLEPFAIRASSDWRRMQTESSSPPPRTLGSPRIASSPSPAPSEGSAGAGYKSYIAESSNINWISRAGRVQHVLCTKRLVPQPRQAPPSWFRRRCATFNLDFFVGGTVGSRDAMWARWPLY